jgi:glycosyltransferase involved in cell wall biosynthesis
MDPLRVFLVSRDFFPREGGAESQTRRLAVFLNKHGFQVTVLTKGFGKLPKKETVDGVQVARISPDLQMKGMGELAFLSALVLQLVNRRDDFEILQVSQTQLAGLLAVFLGKALRKKVILRVSNTGPFFGIAAFWKSIPGGMGILKYLTTRSDAIVVTSSQMKQEVEAIGFPSIKVHLIPSGVVLPGEISREMRSRARARIRIKEKGTMVLFVGRITWQKAPDLLLAAWAEVRRIYPEASLHLVGQGDMQDSLQMMTKKQGMLENVIFHGYTNHITDYYEGADIFVLPSRYEGFPSALIEAMSYGLPVIVSRVSGTDDAVKDNENGLLMPPDDLPGLITRLNLLLSNPELRVRLGAAARMTILENYGMEKVGKRYISLYTQILKQDTDA